MSRIVASISVLSLVAVLALALNYAWAQGAAPFGGAKDIEFSKDLWEVMAKARLVGNRSIASMPYEGGVHKTILTLLDSTARVGGNAGSVIVKKMYQAPDVSVENVLNDPTKNLKVVAVMFKRKLGYDTENQDWFYVRYNADGSLQKNKKGLSLVGRVSKCIACHQAAPGDDLIYSFDR